MLTMTLRPMHLPLTHSLVKSSNVWIKDDLVVLDQSLGEEPESHNFRKAKGPF